MSVVIRKSYFVFVVIISFLNAYPVDNINNVVDTVRIEINNDSTTQLPDTTVSSRGPEHLPTKKVPARSAWEYLVSGPFWAITSPIIAAFYGISKGGGYLQETDITLKISNLLVSPDRTRIIMPYYSSRVGVGLEFQKRGLVSPDSKLTILGTVGTQGRSSALLAFTRVEPWENLLYFSAAGRYTFLSRERFFGVGNETELADSTRYSIRNFGVILVAGKDIFPELSVNIAPLIAQYKTSDPRDDSDIPVLQVFSPQEAPGAEGTVVFGGATIGLSFDIRDSVYRPAKGLLIDAKTGIIDQIDSDVPSESPPFGYALGEADIRAFIPMPWGPHRTLMLRGELQVERNFDNHEIPLYLLSFIGSERMVRGFSNRRFVDNDRCVLSSEYIFPVLTNSWISTDFLFFFDAGQVANNIFTDFSFGDFHSAGGIGLRLYTKKSAIGQFLVGFSNEGFRIYLNAGISSTRRSATATPTYP